MKKIFLVSQNEATGYDTYDSMVVIADNENEAKRFHPSGSLKRCDRTWARSPEAIRVELLGNAKKDSRSGVVLTSFNAG